MTDKELLKVRDIYCKGRMTENQFIAFLYNALLNERKTVATMKDKFSKIQTMAADAYSVMIEVDGLGEGNMECEYVLQIEDTCSKMLSVE